MKSFTKTEITWVIGELDRLVSQYKSLSQMETTQTRQDRCFHRLRADQLESIADRLSEAIKKGDKRIEIKY